MVVVGSGDGGTGGSGLVGAGELIGRQWGFYLVSHPFLHRFVVMEHSRQSAVNHCLVLEAVLRCLWVHLRAGVEEICTWHLELPQEILHHCLVEEGDQAEAKELVFHRIFVGPQTQDQLQCRVQILMTFDLMLYATTTCQCRTYAAMNILSPPHRGRQSLRIHLDLLVLPTC